MFKSDVGSESGSNEDDKEIWLTPPESQSRMSPDLSINREDDTDKPSNIFIFGYKKNIILFQLHL